MDDRCQHGYACRLCEKVIGAGRNFLGGEGFHTFFTGVLRKLAEIAFKFVTINFNPSRPVLRTMLLKYKLSTQIIV